MFSAKKKKKNVEIGRCFTVGCTKFCSSCHTSEQNSSGNIRNIWLHSYTLTRVCIVNRELKPPSPSSSNDALQQHVPHTSSALLFRVYFSKFSSGLQGHILKRGKITEKVIREKYQVTVQKPLGTCQGSLVRSPKTVSTAKPLGAITKLTAMLQRHSRRPLSAVSHRVHEVPKLCMARRWGSWLPYK